MNPVGDRCQCGCGAETPCEYDVRFAIVAECRRLVQAGAEPDTATASVVRRLANGQHKQCPECRRPFLSSRENRTICSDCKKSRDETRERSRSRRRTVSGADAFRRRRARSVAKQRPENPLLLNRAVDDVLMRVGTPHQQRSIGADHVGFCRRSRRRLLAVVAFLEQHGEPLLAIRLLATAKPKQ